MLWTIDKGRSGIIAQQTRLDTIANNLANLNTTGFKKQAVSFDDLLYQEMNAAGRPVERRPGVSPPFHGTGVRAGALTRDFSSGAPIQTNQPLHIAIAGEGFLRVVLPDGTYAYTRDGTLKVSPAGNLVNENGYPLDPAITLPANHREITIRFDGTVLIAGENGASEEIGRLPLYRFPNPGGLQTTGNNLYVPTPASGEPFEGTPGTGGFGVLQQGYLEAANVDPIQEITSLVETQRAYQVSLRVIQDAGEIWNIVNNLRK